MTPILFSRARSSRWTKLYWPPPASSDPKSSPLAHFARGVDVEIFPLTTVDTTTCLRPPPRPVVRQQCVAMPLGERIATFVRDLPPQVKAAERVTTRPPVVFLKIPEKCCISGNDIPS